MPCVSRSLQPAAQGCRHLKSIAGIAATNIIAALGSPGSFRAMPVQSFCGKCGARLNRKRWRALFGGRLCADCARGSHRNIFFAPLGLVAVIAIAAFSFGRYLRPSPPPLIIQRAANSPLSDLPIDANDSAQQKSSNQPNRNSETITSLSNESASGLLYICGARTKKGTPCKRRVHTAGERCYQHKGMPAILPIDKLVAKTK
jgi:hypothetical protein